MDKGITEYLKYKITNQSRHGIHSVIKRKVILPDKS